MKKCSNAEVVKAFYNKEEAISYTGNLTSYGDSLFSYSTCIAQRHYLNKKIIINLTSYSNSTSKHQYNLNKHDVVVYNVPRNTTNLIPYLPK